MKKFLLTLAVVAMGVLQLSAEEPQRVWLPNEGPAYEDMSLWERFISLKTPSTKTQFEFRVGLPLYEYRHLVILKDGDESYYSHSYGSTSISTGGLQGEFLRASYKAGKTYSNYTPEINMMIRWHGRLFCGMTINYNWTTQNRYSVLTQSIAEVNKSQTLFMAPTLRYNLVEWSLFRLYVQAGCNILFVNQTYGGFYPEMDLFWGYGASVGGRLYSFSEANIGNNGSWIASMGVGYRF